MIKIIIWVLQIRKIYYEFKLKIHHNLANNFLFYYSIKFLKQI